mgnify:CR=1 FL=1
MIKALGEITRDEFEAYERVRRGGKYNMWDPRAKNLAGLDRETYLTVMHFYGELMALYPTVRKGGA